MNNHGERVTAVFEAAVLLEPAERLSFVREVCADDPALQRQVESLLADVDQPVVIDRPVDEAIADLMDDDTPVVVGAQFGPYRVESLLGAGGMGAVYRATDTVLGRQVAIKILPADVAADPEWVARFRREAQALAALNHPNVGAIYGFETLDGRTGSAFCLVLELVEGPTLAEKLNQGPLPVEEALAIAQQIADALDAAHQQRIVHRDLKPGNIKVRDDGTVKVLDFGLSKVATLSENVDERSAFVRGPSLSPTIVPPPITAAGTILGTAAYMSPEQAKGHPVTRTTDIWAFGCVLYEMLTGRVPFKGDSTTDTLALIVRGEPDFGLLPSTTPPGIRTLLRHCLHKEQRRRWQDAASLRIAIEDARAAPTGVATPAELTRPLNWRRMIVSAFVVVAAAALSALGAWSLARQEPPRAVARVLIGVSPASQIARTLQLPNARPFRSAIALSPDGMSLVFVGALPEGLSTAVFSPSLRGPGAPPRLIQGSRQLYLRTMDQLNATPIEGTERAESPFFSPDGRWVGFWQAGAAGLAQLGELKKVPIRGGPAVTLCRTALPAGITWGPNGRIIFANHGGGGLWQVTDAGGTPEMLTTPDAANGELSHSLPHVLPDGNAVLFTVQRSRSGWDDAQVVVRSLVTGEQKLLVDGATDAQYVASGHLVYARLGTLLAQPFDVTRLEVTGKPVGVVDDVMHDVNSPFTIGNSGAAQFSVSSNGTLAYLPGGAAAEGDYISVWVDRSGVDTEVGIPPRTIASRPRISPDGGRIAFPALEGIGMFDVARRSFQLLTPSAWGPLQTRAPEFRFVVWHPNGERVAFSGADGDLYWMTADGSGHAERLTVGDANARASGRVQVPASWSPDGRTLVFTQRVGSNRDIWALTVGDPVPATRPFVLSPSDEPSAEISPDGRYLAYESNQSGRLEIYVQPFPGSGRRELVSIDGGSQPVWARSGRELFYRAPGPGPMMRMMAVDVRLGDVFTAGKPRVLWEAMNLRYPAGTGGRTYDVAPDGQRFLMIQQRDSAPQTPLTYVVLVQNWLDEVKRLAPRN